MNIGWIGTGVMGSPMALHLALAGHQVTVYNRTYEKAKALEPQVKAVETIEALCQNVEVIFSIVGYPNDVELIYKEVFKYAKKGTILVDMTTSSPTLALNLAIEAKKSGLFMLDAPVTGGDKGAREATLSIMVGGEYDTYQTIEVLLKKMGTTITYAGGHGMGQSTKLANQLAIAGSLIGTVEAIVYALDNQLDLEAVMNVLSKGSAQSWQLIHNGSKMIIQDYTPGFFIKHFLKDLNLAIESAKTVLKGALLVKEMLEYLVERTYQDYGTQALILYYLDQKVITK